LNKANKAKKTLEERVVCIPIDYFSLNYPLTNSGNSYQINRYITMLLRLLPITAAAMLLGDCTCLISPLSHSSRNSISSVAFVSRTSSNGASSPLFMSSMQSSTTFQSTPTYGIEGPGREKEEDKDPAEDIQSYIDMPDSIAAKANLDGTVLVSGWVKTRERTDQTVFDLLNHEDSAMKFDKIVAFVDDVKFAKKRLLSRSARYTGLLDKLDFAEAAEKDALPTADQLEGVKHWVANVEDGNLDTVKAIAALCQAAPSLENVSVLLSGAKGLDVEQSKEAIQALDGNSERCKFAIVAVGELKEHQEGSRPYDVENFGTEGGVIPDDAVVSRDESLRLVTECLQLETGSNKALTFTEIQNTNTTENVGARLIKGLREAGYTRPQELDHMIGKGIGEYDTACKKFQQEKFDRENPDPELVQKEKEERDRKAAIQWEQSEKEFEERKKKEIEDTARTWAKREYFRKSMGGNMGMTEEEYIVKVWDRAMFEGDLKYRMMHGGETDERAELAVFMTKQEKKKQAALKKAKKALEGKLGDLLDGDDDDDDDDE